MQCGKSESNLNHFDRHIKLHLQFYLKICLRISAHPVDSLNRLCANVSVKYPGLEKN